MLYLYLVDDLMATGESAVNLKKELQRHGIGVTGYINLINVSNRYSSERDKERLAGKILDYVPVADGVKLKADIEAYLGDYTRQKQNKV